MSVKNYRDYRVYLDHKISENQDIKGYKSKLAKALNIQSSYFSQILSGKIDLSADHALALSEFWEFSDDDTDFFISLVHLERAATPALRKRILKKIDRHAQFDHAVAAHPLPNVQLDIIHASEFCSTWEYAAVNVALDLPDCNTVKAIAKTLSITEKNTLRILKSLEAMGYVNNLNDVWSPSENNNFSIPTRALQNLFQTQIRERARQPDMSPNTDNFFTGFVTTLSRDQAYEFRDELRALVEKFKAQLGTAKDELVIAFAVDFIQLSRNI